MRIGVRKNENTHQVPETVRVEHVSALVGSQKFVFSIQASENTETII